MIQFQKLPVPLANLMSNGAVLMKKREIEDWLTSGRVGPDPQFPDYWNRNDVRGALIAQQGLVCAWCQQQLKVLSKETTVDHFRPKDYTKPNPKLHRPADPHTGYPWLAYEWDNLLLACSDCNSFKGTKFPLADETRRVDEQTRNQIDKEQPLILNPTTDDLEETFQLELQDNSPFHQFKVNKSHPNHLAVRETLECFHLNGSGRPEFFQERQKAIEAQLKAIENSDDDACRLNASSFRPYSKVARLVLLRHNATNLIPKEEDELFYLLTDLWAMLKQTEDHMAFFLRDANTPETKKSTKAIYTKRLGRIREAFAVLCFCHPLKMLATRYTKKHLSAESQKAIERYKKKLAKNQTSLAPAAQQGP